MTGFVSGPTVRPVDSHEHYMAGDSDFAKFDPNAPRSSNVWAMFDGAQFRTFSTRSAAINAFHRATMAQLFELRPDGWRLVTLKSHRAKHFCDRCQAAIDPAKVANPNNRWSRQLWRWELKRTPGGKLIHPLVCECLCGQSGCK